MGADLPTSKPALAYDAKDVANLCQALQEKEAELVIRKRFQEELYALINSLEKRFNECTVQLATTRQEMRLERQRHLECQMEITRLSEILVREQQVLGSANDELDAFTYSVAHDLRAPLRHIRGYATALKEDCAESLDGTALGYLERLERAGSRMESQMEALLTLTRIARQELRLSSVDLGELAGACAAALRQSAPERTVVFEIQEQLCAQADLAMMQAALGHLLENAWKYTGNREVARIEFGKQEKGRVYYLRDNGVGFDMRYADRLFGPFQRMHNESDFAGTGIGLATVQRIIHRHGGKIWASAEVGVGATFYFTLSSLN